jgi:hypothetical protein
MSAIRCSRHPRAPAGWRCRGCEAALCPDCTYLHRTGTAALPACTRCRGIADPITISRAETRPFPARVPAALAWPFRGPGILAILGLGLVLWLLKKFGVPGLFLAAGVFWGYVFSVVRRAAIGDDTLGPPDFSDFFEDIVSPAIRGVVATAALWLPAVLYVGAVLGAGTPLREAVRDPVVWLLAALGVAYGPAGIIVAAAARSILSVVNPVVGVQVILRLGRDYWVAAAAVGALLLANAGVGLAAAFVAATGVPVLSAWIAESATCVLPLVAARVLGLLLHVRGDALGYGDAGAYLDPVLGDAVPRGAEPVLATHEPEPSAEPSVAIALEPPRAAPEDPAAAIATALAANDPAGATALFARHRGPDAAIPPRMLFEIAKAAADVGQHGLSARALHAAGTGKDAAVAPNALLVLARVYERRLALPAEARQVLSFLVARWPDSDAARHAREDLGRPGAS